jgi:Asp-tRNA(Asn)/Glu-tRNA(Gln) amidotransferase A subunit family amidase
MQRPLLPWLLLCVVHKTAGFTPAASSVQQYSPFTYTARHNAHTLAASSRAPPIEVVDADVVDEVPERLTLEQRLRASSLGSSKSLFERDPEVLQQEFEALAVEIVAVVREAGARVGLRRSLQATRAILTTTRDVLLDLRAKDRLNAQTGLRGMTRSDIARSLRLLFERMGSTYIKVCNTTDSCICLRSVQSMSFG